MTDVVLFVLLGLSAGALLVIAGQIAEAHRAPRRRGAAAAGDYLPLASGWTHYRWDGPESGPVVVCIHGQSTPLQVFDPLVAQLTAQGCRVLRYDHYGRGASDTSYAAQTADFLTQHLAAVLDALDVQGPVPLIGYSMGGAIATAFADRYPKRCAGLCLLASAGLRGRSTGLYRLTAELPVLGDALWSLLAPSLLVNGAKATDSRRLPAFPEIIAREVSRQGTLPVQLSASRHILQDEQDDAHARLHMQRLPVLAVWGGRDAVIPIQSSARLKAANPDAQTVLLEAAEHDLAITHVDDVAAVLLPWLARADIGDKRPA